MPPWLNKSDYARHRRAKGLIGQSPEAVYNAITTGRIQWDPVRGLIDAEKADVDWEANTDPAMRARLVPLGIENGKRFRLKKLNGGVLPPKATTTVAPHAATIARAELTVSKANKEFFESELSRLKFEEKQKALIPASQVKKVMYEAGRIIRAGHENIVQQMAPDLAAETDILKVEAILKESLDLLDTALAERIDKIESNMADEDQPDCGATDEDAEEDTA